MGSIVDTSNRQKQQQDRDICVNAPTGSGKTLAFVIPILHLLSGRRITHIRALIVLPSRDLAQQAYKVFNDYSKGSTLKIGLCVSGNNTTTTSSKKKKRKNNATTTIFDDETCNNSDS